MEQIYLGKTGNGELYPLHVGHYVVPGGNSYGPFVRDYYVLHAIHSGKGVLINQNGSHEVSAGEMFLIRPGELTTYVADENDPYEYVWIAFSGSRARQFDDMPDVLNTPEEMYAKLYEHVINGEKSTDPYTALLYEMMYSLFKESSTEEQEEIITEVHRYIKYNYAENITVSRLAARFGFERSYLYRLFKARYGVGPKEYLTRVRLEKAKWLLSRGFSVSECAFMVGYSDAFTFSKAYKKFHGISPSFEH
ncbi:MAG: AraC family transcriptional regulator [Clostridia bacterium]|nr:AraC family transcriptional regulator [Clostridia bacterium]